jgi:hypothetical protein
MPNVEVSTYKNGMERVHGVRCKTSNNSYHYTHVAHCVTAKDAYITIQSGVEEMPLPKVRLDYN